MRKLQNKGMGNRKRQGNMTPQNVNNHTKDLTDSEKDNTSASKPKRMMIRMVKEVKEDMHKQINEI
jgi:hypothetical protein